MANPVLGSGEFRQGEPMTERQSSHQEGQGNPPRQREGGQRDSRPRGDMGRLPGGVWRRGRRENVPGRDGLRQPLWR